MEHVPQREPGTTRDIVAAEVGFGNKETYRQVKFIADRAEPEVILKLSFKDGIEPAQK